MVTLIHTVGTTGMEQTDHFGISHCLDRIAALRSLRDGWHDGACAAPTAAAAEAALSLLALKPRMAGSYRIFPTDLGGLLFEFGRHDWDYAVEIGPDGLLSVYGVESGGAGEMATGALAADSPEFAGEFGRVTADRG